MLSIRHDFYESTQCDSLGILRRCVTRSEFYMYWDRSTRDSDIAHKSEYNTLSAHC